MARVVTKGRRGLRYSAPPSIMFKRQCPLMLRNVSNSHLPECWLHSLVCPRRYRANLPSRLRPSLFGSD